jgi:shikimate kinase
MAYRRADPQADAGSDGGFGGTMTASEMDVPPLVLPRTLVLVGLMGAGKSAIGRRLAARLGIPFRDADKEIEAAAGCAIEDIFAQYGEAAFRDGEKRVIARLLTEEPVHVLATGGGAFMDRDTRRAIQDHGLSLWLRADLDLLVERTSRRNNRPLLKSGEPRAILAKLMEERYPVYAEADLVVDSGAGSPEQMVDRVIGHLARYLTALGQNG